MRCLSKCEASAREHLTRQVLGTTTTTKGDQGRPLALSITPPHHVVSFCAAKDSLMENQPVMNLSPHSAIDRLMRRDPALLADPYPTYRALREDGPMLRVTDPADGPSWLNAWHLFAYDDIAAALRDGRLSSQRAMAALPIERFGIDPTSVQARFFETMQTQMMLTMDAPDHTRLRRLAVQAFTPRVVASMRDDIQAIVDQLLDAVDARGEATFDLMADVAAPLPTIVIAQLLGIPAADWASFKRWSDGIIGFDLTDEKLENFYELGQYLRARIAERRALPRDDLISGLIAARDQNDALSEDELVGQCIILLVGGHETTTYALGNGVYRLLSDRQHWHSLPVVPIADAIEELLRYDSPFQALARRAAVDLQIDAQDITAGDTVWLWIAAANHDPERFPKPEALQLRRADNRHLSFGLGPHYCLGAALARLELQVAIATLRQRYSDLRLHGTTIDWKQEGAIRGPRALPVTTGVHRD
jgi:cytochrome P450